MLSAVVHALSVDDLEFAQCFFIAGAAVNGRVAVLTNDGSEALLGDVTLTSSTNPVFLRCSAQGGTVQAAGQMIATKVGTVTSNS